MNKALKLILILLNFSMLSLAVLWFRSSQDWEPGLAIGGQIAALLALIFEDKVATVLTKNTKNNSKVDIDARSGDTIHTIDTDNSEIKVKTH